VAVKTTRPARGAYREQRKTYRTAAIGAGRYDVESRQEGRCLAPPEAPLAGVAGHLIVKSLLGTGGGKGNRTHNLLHAIHDHHAP
jgi:hypothetical protein